LDRGFSPLGAREVAMAQQPIEIDSDKVRAAIRKLGNEQIFYMLDEAINFLSEESRAVARV
jgi:hypothetical protein